MIDFQIKNAKFVADRMHGKEPELWCATTI